MKVSLALVAGVCTLSAASAFAEEITLRLKFRAGEIRRYRFQDTTEIEMAALPPPINQQRFDISSEMGMKVLSVEPDGGATIEFLPGKFAVTPPIFKADGNALAGCRAKVTSMGKMSVDEKTCKVSGSQARVLRSVEKMLGGMKALPPGPVKPGASWRVPFEMELPSALAKMPGQSGMRGDATLTFREVKQQGPWRCAIVPIRGDLKLDFNTPRGNIDITARIEGENCFEINRGDWVQAKLSMKTSFAIVGATPGQQLGGSATSRFELQRLAETDLPKDEAPQGEAAKPDATKEDAKQDAPKPDALKPDAPKQDAPKQDAPKQDAPKQDAPKPDAPKQDAPKPEAPKDAP